MNIDAENLRLILGVKIKQLRAEQDLSLSELAAKSGLSVSYLSEIEKGKKYPTPDKIIQIANAIGVSFDELVSAKMSASLDPLTIFLKSPLIKEFPFELFGIQPRDLVGLITESPQEAGAFIQTLLEIGQNYDMSVEQFLFAALRSYQKLHSNYFEELETAAEEFARKHKLKIEQPVREDQLFGILKDEFGYEMGEIPFREYPELKKFRSISTKGKTPKLFLNDRLLPSQRAFLLAREIGFRTLGLKEHPITSTWLEVGSFAEVLNNYKASYFAGALFINRIVLRKELDLLFKRTTWNGNAFLNIMRRFEATPEMFLYRLSQIIPTFFGMQEMFYLRFNNEVGSKDFVLTKELNMSRVVVPHAIGLNEHYCRRWLSITLLQQLAEMPGRTLKESTITGVQRSRFMDGDAEFFVISVARPLALTENTNSSISLGFLLNDNFKNTVGFWNDSSIPVVEVNETCERCSLPKAACKERAVPPLIHRKHQLQKEREASLQRFLKSVE
ncbi:MAG: helix-turn-helix domain-containing protein [Bacteroidetes bacterium]|nr:helix-turn-helix domain-containing protein [Bacteroidota bacterium]MCW5896949.1 helix-turn-helix domain-containing protein [Bacteroidota bacterium]